MNTREVRERHAHWWQALCDRVPVLDKTPPNCVFSVRKSGCAGRGGSRQCTYNLAYVMTVPGDAYDNTVCHEVCHAFAQRVMGRAVPHGEFWWFLFHHVCGAKRGKTHNYDVAKAKAAVPAISALMRLQTKRIRLAADKKN